MGPQAGLMAARSKTSGEELTSLSSHLRVNTVNQVSGLFHLLLDN